MTPRRCVRGEVSDGSTRHEGQIPEACCRLVRGDPKVEEVAAGLGLPNGRLISSSKTGYHDLYPRNFAMFNASIADDAGKLLWWGDLDLTVDEAKLVGLAQTLGQRLHLLFEGSTHFQDPLPVEAAAIVIEPDASVVLSERFLAVRDADGLIVHEARPEDDRSVEQVMVDV
jgi:hypothetical protein